MKKTSKNEFDEIRNLKAKHTPPINKEDMVDFQIDCGLYNKNCEKNLKKTPKAPKRNKGKKKCVKLKPRTRKNKKINGIQSSDTLENTKKSLNLETLDLQSYM
jgi:hypothetical protein